MTKNDIGYGCEAVLRLGRTCEFSCMLEAGHGGPHYDEFTHGEQTVVIVWHTKPFTVSIADKEE